MEYARKSEEEAFAAITARIRENTRLILEKARSEKVLPRVAAVDLANARVFKAMVYRDY